MMYGGPFSVPFGDIEEFYLDYLVDDAGDGGYITLSAVAGYGDSYHAIVADQKIVEIIHLAEGETKRRFAPYDPDYTGAHAVSAFPLGDWDSAGDIDVRIAQDDFVSDKGSGVQVSFPAVMQVSEAWGDDGQLENWVLTGLARFATSRAGQISTQAKVDVRLFDTAGTRTVRLMLGETILAEGSRVGDGSVTLSAQNESGLSGTVDVTYTADITDDCWVTGCWCRSYVVDVGGITRTVFDNGRGDRLSVSIADVPAGVQPVTITATSDKGIAGTPLVDSVTVPGRPGAPGPLAYVSGDWTDTVVEAQASVTPGATYALFDVEDLDGPIKWSEVRQTYVAGSGVIQFTLPSLPSAGSGLRRLAIVAQNDTIQDGLRRTITIEYLAGVVVLPRPNIPAFEYAKPEPVTAGRTIQVDYSYNSNEQRGVATKMVAFLLAEGDLVPADGATPDVEQTLTTAFDGIYRGRMSLTAPSDGNYTVLLRAQTALGTQSTNAIPLAEPVPVSNVAPPAPASVEIVVVQ